MNDTSINWNDIQAVYEKSKFAAVSFDLIYEESNDIFYFVINSAAPTEKFIGNPSSFKGAVRDVLEWLDSLSNGR